jgi:hypothetical protein
MGQDRAECQFTLICGILSTLAYICFAYVHFLASDMLPCFFVTWIPTELQVTDAGPITKYVGHNILILYAVTFMFLDGREEGRNFCK